MEFKDFIKVLESQWLVFSHTEHSISGIYLIDLEVMTQEKDLSGVQNKNKRTHHSSIDSYSLNALHLLLRLLLTLLTLFVED